MVVLTAFLAGCAGKVDYIRPDQVKAAENTKVVERNRDAVWAAAIPELSKQFYVINNLDKPSGLINISYSGSPEKYMDCGRVSSYVKNARGERTYNFAAASPMQSYETMTNGNLFFYERTMALDGRINLIFEEIGPNQTRITANTKYVVTKAIVARNAANNIPQSISDTISFNTKGRATFPSRGNTTVAATECVSTGYLEQEILSAIK